MHNNRTQILNPPRNHNRQSASSELWFMLELSACVRKNLINAGFFLSEAARRAGQVTAHTSGLISALSSLNKLTTVGEMTVRDILL